MDDTTAQRADLRFGSIPRLVQDDARRFPDREALIDADGGRRWTFAALAAEVRAAAKAFVAAGVAHGDRVGIWAPNVAEWVVAALGAQTVGAVLVPLNTRFKGAEAAYILGKSGARLLVCANGFLGNDYVGALRAAQVDTPLPTLGTVVVLPGASPVPDGTVGWDEFLDGGASVPDAEVDARLGAVGPDDVADLIFTSGTTGRPKGVMITHAQNLRVFEAWSDLVGLTEGDRYLIVNPFFHTFGCKAGILACLLRGATIVPEPVLDLPRVLARIESERISMMAGAPTLFLSILEAPGRDRYDLSSLRLAVTGAAFVPVALVQRMRSELTFRTVLTGYGLTESTGTATMCRHDDDAETVATTSGRAIPDVEVRIVDAAGAEVPRGQAGEIWVRGYNVMRGYFEEPERTAEVITPDGWLKTGDVGVMDERGYVRITDRIKDMFIVGGFNAYPAEIEDVLVTHPAVAQAAVVGMPDERMGEVGCAFVVPRAGATLVADDVVAFARERLANFKVPRRVVVVDTLPLNASGKVLKYELRGRAAEEASGTAG